MGQQGCRDGGDDGRETERVVVGGAPCGTGKSTCSHRKVGKV